MAVQREEARRDWERPLDVTGDLRFSSRCWRCSKRAATAPATAAETVYLGVPPDVELCSDCACLVPEGYEPETEELIGVADRRTVVDWEYDEEKFIPVGKDRTKSLKRQQSKWDSEEYGCWK